MIIEGKVWGTTKPLFNKNNVELHDIFINHGGYCSKHKHTAKYNKFIVLSGRLLVRVWRSYGLEDLTVLTPGTELTVSPGEYHQFEALEDTHALEIYWVELRADDIERENHGGTKPAKTLPKKSTAYLGTEAVLGECFTHAKANDHHPSETW